MWALLSAARSVAGGGGVDATPDPLSDRAAGTTSLLSEKLRTRFSEQCNKVHLTPMQRRIKLRKRVRQHASYMYAAGRQMLLPGVRDEILAWAGLQDSKFIDAFSSRQTALFPKYWDVKADALIQDWSYGSQDKGDHTDFFLWIHCPHFLLQQTVDKILLDQSRGIMLLPVQKDQSWFWQMGEAAVDWWDSDPPIPIYCDDSGIVYKQPAKWTTRVVLFDAMGLRDAKSHDKRWEDDSGPVGEGKHRHLVCSQACGHCEQCSQTGLE